MKDGYNSKPALGPKSLGGPWAIGYLYLVEYHSIGVGQIKGLQNI